MALSDYKYAKVRELLLDAVRKDLIGPQSEDEIIQRDTPDKAYLTGMLYPADTNMSEEDNFEEIDFTEGHGNSQKDADGQDTDSSIFSDDNSDAKPGSGFKKPSSLGVSFYVSKDVTKLDVTVLWGTYVADKLQDGEIAEEDPDDEKEEDKKRNAKSFQVYRRTQHNDVVELDLTGKRSQIYQLDSNPNIMVYMVQMNLNTGYKMVSVYVHNRMTLSDADKEYEKIMYQVEVLVADEGLNPIFVPEYICRRPELPDEYYYKKRPVYARGRGCAAVWDHNPDEQNAYAIRSSFIPDYEISGVSASLEKDLKYGIPKHTFSMFYMGLEKKKAETIEGLNLLTEQYGKWIQDNLVNSPEMKNPDFHETGAEIISKFEKARNRISDGIKLLTENEKAFQAFLFMNQAMRRQWVLNQYAQKNGKGKECSIGDFQDLSVEKNNYDWRPFQIAFILLNLRGIVDKTSPDRECVDLLYFPTGGGKTEAYLGLIAFTVAYRRLTASESNIYDKDGGVTVFLRYTLRLLTTQQRDRLMKLVVAMEIIRQESAKAGNYKYGHTPISIGFWVGGGVTPNRFTEYSLGKPYDKKNFIRKIKNQIITCPYCGKEITEKEYEIDSDRQIVKIHCPDKKCYFGPGKQHFLPVHLVDEEIYRQCPTVVIATVDKFAQLPWSEQVGLLFGRTNRFCPRHGFIAEGENHPQKHRKDTDAHLDATETQQHRPFYPPELIVQDELHLITGPLGTIYGGYETVIEDLCTVEEDGKKVKPKYIVSTATIRNAGEQVRALYARESYAQFPPDGFNSGDSFFVKEVPLPEKDVLNASEDEVKNMDARGEKPFRKYAGICAAGQSVKTTLTRLYAAILQKTFELSETDEYRDYVDPYYTLIGYFNSIRELGGAVRLLDDDITARIDVLRRKHQALYGTPGVPFWKRFINRKEEITSRMPSWKIAKTLELLATPFDPTAKYQQCYDVVIATNMIAVGMDVSRLGLMTVVGQPKQNAEYIQATSRVGRSKPGLIFTVYNPYRPRDLSNYENFVGFHSQIYRYVEGTTATPFAARARDRMLHALVIALLRLGYKDMATNDDAHNLPELSDEDLNKVKKVILDRVDIVEPGAHFETEQEIDSFLGTWRDLCRDNDALVYHNRYKDTKPRLMHYYATEPPKGLKEVATLNSMRDVEQAARLFYYPEGGAGTDV